MKKLALFDFDKTIVSVDSVVAFKNFLVKKGFKINDFNDAQFDFKLDNDAKNLINKQNWVQVFSGRELSFLKSEVDEFVETFLINKTIKETFKYLIDYVEQDIEIIILSASYRLILEKYFNLVGLCNLKIICTELDFINNTFTGNFKGLNCSGVNKIIKLKHELELEKYDLKNSYAFTDHISDIPFLALVGNRVVVHLKDGKDDWSHLFNTQHIVIE